MISLSGNISRMSHSYTSNKVWILLIAVSRLLQILSALQHLTNQTPLWDIIKLRESRRQLQLTLSRLEKIENNWLWFHTSSWQHLLSVAHKVKGGWILSWYQPQSCIKVGGVTEISRSWASSLFYLTGHLLSFSNNPPLSVWPHAPKERLGPCYRCLLVRLSWSQHEKEQSWTTGAMSVAIYSLPSQHHPQFLRA